MSILFTKNHISLSLSLIKFVNSIYKYLSKVNATSYDIYDIKLNVWLTKLMKNEMACKRACK